MASFQQCQRCGTFLLSVDAVNSINHLQCPLNSSSPTEDKKPDLEAWEKSGLLAVTFPEMRIHLTRLISTPVSCSKPLTHKHLPSDHPPRRKRKIRQISATSSSGEKDACSAAPYIASYRFDCKQCTGKFYSKVEYDRHMNVHTGSRRLMKCIVCFRMFNKRDSLNQHYAAHENAEEREEKLNLMHSWPKRTCDDPNPRIRQACKYCLLIHTNKESFVKHMNADHDHVHDRASVFPCSLDKCSKTFTTIKDLLQHAKDSHPLSFFGKFTLNRREGVYEVSKRVKLRSKPEVNRKKRSTKLRKKKALHDDNSTDFSSDDEIINACKTRKIGSSEGLERKVELERVHIMEQMEQNCSKGVFVKKENPNFYEQEIEIDPFIMCGLTNQSQNVLSESVRGENKISSNATEDSIQDSVPIVLAIKREKYY